MVRCFDVAAAIVAPLFFFCCTHLSLFTIIITTDGEEGSRGLRFFTHGYDVYTPDRVLVTHDYKGHQSNPVVHTWGRQHGKLHSDKLEVWREEIEKERPKVITIGTPRVNMMLGIGPDNYSEEECKEIKQMRASRFGLGTKRTLEQAIEFSGINLRERKMVKNKCGNLKWVPFEESDDYGLSATLGRGLIDQGTGVAPGTVNVGGSGPKSFTNEQVANFVRVVGILILILGVYVMYGGNRKKSVRHTH